MAAPLLRSLARGVYRAAPARLWHRLDGLRDDLRSLPARLRDPELRADPWAAVHHVGGGDFRQVGAQSLRLLIDHGGLAPDDRLLDIGCGVGRVALPLGEVLGPSGGYLGFDVSRAAIRYCRRRFATARPDFEFHHLDVRNRVYNPRGAMAEARVAFPCADASVTLAFAMSVLTHLRLDAVRRYLAEVRRVLAPGGRALLSTLVVTPQVREWALEGRLKVPLRPFGPGAMAVDLQWPENGIGYDEAVIGEAVVAAGLTLEKVLIGDWRPGADHAGGQDLLVLRR